MKYFYKKVSAILITCLMTMLLSSCINKSENVLNESKVGSSVNEKEMKSKLDELSPIRNEQWFKNGVHSIRNNLTNTYMIVNGNGDIIVKSLEPELEAVGVVRDVDKNVVNYVYKSYTGESIVKSTFSGIDYEYTDMNPSTRCRIFDRNGNDIGFEAKIYSPQYSSKNKIIFAERNDETYSNQKAFDVNTKEYIELNYSESSTMDSNFIFSTSPFNYKSDRQEMLIADEDLKEIKKIEGYSLDFVVEEDGVQYAMIRKRLSNSEDSSNNYKYNFLDSNYEFILDEDVDENIWTGNRKILTLRVGDKVYDYDVLKKEKVGEERDYKTTEDPEQLKRVELEKQYEPLMNKIKQETLENGKEKYYYMDLLVYKDTTLILASVYVEDNTYDHNPIDIYNTEGEQIASFNNLSTRFQNDGYLISNNDTVFNTEFKEVAALKGNRNIDRFDKFGKVFYADNMDDNYNYVDSFTIYNEKFEHVFENVECAEFDTYDDYIVIVDKDGTKIVDKDLNVVKTINRKLEIKNWYDNETNYREFTDLITKRMGLIDSNFNYIIDNINFIGYKEEKYFNYQNGFEYGLMDYEGRPILKYSIFDSMIEDAKLSDLKGNFIEY